MTSKHEKRSEDWSRAALARRYDDLFEAYQTLVNPSSQVPSLLQEAVVDDVHIRIDRAHIAMEHIEDRLQDGNEDLVRKIKKLEHETQQLKKEYEHLQNRNHGLEKERDRLEKENDDLRSQNEHLDNENDNLRHRNEHLENDRQNLEIQVRNQENVIEEVLAQNSSMTAELEESRETRETQATDQMAMVIGHNGDLEDKLKEMNERSQGGAPSGDNQDLYESPGLSSNSTLSHASKLDDPETPDTGNNIEPNHSQLVATDGADIRLESSDHFSQSERSEDRLKECSQECQRLRHAMKNQEWSIDKLKHTISDLEDDLESIMDKKSKWRNTCLDWEARHAGLDADWREKYDNLRERHDHLKAEYEKRIRADNDARSEVQTENTGGDIEQCAEKCKEWEEKYYAAVSQGQVQRADLWDHLERKCKILEGENASLKMEVASRESLREPHDGSTPASPTCAEKCQEWEEKHNVIAADYDELKKRTNPYDLDHKLEQALKDKERYTNDCDYWRDKYDSLLAKSSSVKERRGVFDIEEKLRQAEKETNMWANKHADAIKEQNAWSSAHTQAITEKNAVSQQMRALEDEHVQLAEAYDECDSRCRETEQICGVLEDKCDELNQRWVEKYRALVTRSVEAAKEWQVRHDALVAKIKTHRESDDIQDISGPGYEVDDGTEECRDKCRQWKAKYEEAEEKYGSLVTDWTALKRRNIGLLDESLECYRKQGVICEKFDKLVDAVFSSVRTE